MNYILKQFDEPLVKFSATTDTSEPEIQILWTNEEKAAFLPLDLTLTPDGLSRWLRRRTIPKNRAYVHSLLAKCGLNLNRPLSIISVCKGLSLNDCYWVVEDGDTASFGKVNLYDNPFSNVLAELAFTGYGSSVRTSLLSSPEFTTNGMLRKCWRRIGGKVYLYISPSGTPATTLNRTASAAAPRPNFGSATAFAPAARSTLPVRKSPSILLSAARTMSLTSAPSPFQRTNSTSGPIRFWPQLQSFPSTETVNTTAANGASSARPKLTAVKEPTPTWSLPSSSSGSRLC